jgi:hypothetical protein
MKLKELIGITLYRERDSVRIILYRHDTLGSPRRWSVAWYRSDGHYNGTFYSNSADAHTAYAQALIDQNTFKE